MPDHVHMMISTRNLHKPGFMPGWSPSWLRNRLPGKSRNHPSGSRRRIIEQTHTPSPSRWRMTKMALASIRETIRALSWTSIRDALKKSLRHLCEQPRKRRKQQDHL